MKNKLRPSPAIDAILTSQKVVVCAGSGGVGKTTIAAALGVRAAQLGLRTLVLTVDPAKRLATALGLDLSDDTEKRVPSQSYPGELSAAVIDSRKTFDHFIVRHAKDRAAGERILRNRLYQQLSTTLSGSQEFTSLERLLEAVESQRYDLVILDTPPTKHAMDFLMAPQRIHSLFQDSVTKWFIEATQPGGGLISNLVSRGTRTVLKSLEVLTGGQFIEELVDFFAAIRSVQTSLRDRSIAVQKLLSGARTKFIVVTSFDAAKLDEAKYLQTALRKMGFALEAIVINRAYPMWLPEDIERERIAQSQGPEQEKVLLFYERFKQFHALRYNLYEEFAKQMRNSARIFRVPEYAQDVYGLEDLESLAACIAEGAETK
ncbi:MAG: AAA family ATPase [Bdellovibrionaceae bacterium]|nr:AAA family ATPase [Pseudobdellovibrionaceae bacterium]